MKQILMILYVMISYITYAEEFKKDLYIEPQFDRYEIKIKNCPSQNKVSYIRVVSMIIPYEKSKMKNVKKVEVMDGKEVIYKMTFDPIKSKNQKIYYYVDNLHGKRNHYEYFETDQDHLDLLWYFSPKYGVGKKLGMSVVVYSDKAPLNFQFEMPRMLSVDRKMFILFDVEQVGSEIIVKLNKPSASNTEIYLDKKIKGEDVRISRKLETGTSEIRFPVTGEEEYLALQSISGGYHLHENKVVLKDNSLICN